MDPSTLENILMLKFNSDLYRATDIFDLKQNTVTPNQQLEIRSPDSTIRPLDIAMSSSSSIHISSNSSSSSHRQSMIAFGRGISSNSREGSRGRGSGARGRSMRSMR